MHFISTLYSHSAGSLGSIGHYGRSTSALVTQILQSQVAVEVDFDVLQYDRPSEWYLGLGARSQVFTAFYIVPKELFCAQFRRMG